MDATSVIYARVKGLCEDNHISSNKLEAEAGLSQGTISKWRNARPTIENLYKVASFFNVSLDYLVGASDIRATASDIVNNPYYETFQRGIDQMGQDDKDRVMTMLKAGFGGAFDDPKEKA